jgi:UDP:flavonoid glycosyltransferase YjiC (YdhE family)
MASILYAWEFGNAYGHIGAFLPLAQRLRERAHTVGFALAQTEAAHSLLGAAGFTWMQSPVVRELALNRPPLSYADILIRFGYANVETLLGSVVAWRELIRLTGAHLILPDHAPTAILAARTLSVPILTYSYGFCVPPPVTPTPNMRPWIDIDPAPLHEAENIALRTMNQTLQHFGRPPLGAVAELFHVAEPSLMTFPELDHYVEQRGPTTYWGSLVSSLSGEQPCWPEHSGPRLFAYLRPDVRHAEATLNAIRQLGFPCLAVFPGAPAELRHRFQGTNIVLSDKPFDTEALLAGAEIGITYGGHGLSVALLRAGKPLLVLPGQLEQFMLARRIEAIGAGILVDPERPADDIIHKIGRLAHDPSYARNARAFATKYAGFNQETILTNLIRRIETMSGETSEEGASS